MYNIFIVKVQVIQEIKLRHDYRPISKEARKLLLEGHQNPELIATLESIASDGFAPLPDNSDGDLEDVNGIAVKHRFVDAPGESEMIRWHYVEAGAGEPLLLLHGIPQSWRMFMPILPELAKRFRCVALDLKGYGQSHKERGDYRHEGVAEQVVSLLDTIGIDRFSMFSHDRGTVQADFIAAKHTKRVNRWIRGSQHLVHYHPDLSPQEHILSEIETREILQDPLRMISYIYRWTCKYPIPRPNIELAVQEFSRKGVGLAVERYFQSSTFRKDWIDRRTRLIPEWKMPILILQGLEEPPMPVENYTNLEEYLPGAQVEFVDGGHFYVEENPQGTLEKVLPFLCSI